MLARPPAASPRIGVATGSPALRSAVLREGDLLPAAKRCSFGRAGARSMTCAGFHRCDRGCGGSIRPSRSAPHAALRLRLLA